jgi:CRP-like cAMP-binding protein
MAIGMLGALCRRLRQTNRFIEDAVMFDVSGRLRKKLLELADTYGIPTPEGTVIRLRVTPKELATMVGATLGTVSRELRRYRSEGILELNRQGIILRHPDRLLGAFP